MPEKATNEFWRDLKPITKVFQPDAKPEVYMANAPTDDERYYVPFTETVSSRGTRKQEMPRCPASLSVLA